MNSYFYLIFFPLHFFAAISLFYSNHLNLPLIFMFWILLSGFGVGVTLHRLLGHRAFDTYAWLKNLLSLVSCFCAQGSPLFWVNLHRGYHHKFADQEMDLHSPNKGKIWSYCLWACRINPYDLDYKSVPDLLRSKFQVFISRFYYIIVWLGWLFAWLISPQIFFSLVISQIITLHLEFCVNLFCHSKIIPFGYRNFDTPDDSRNFWLFGVLCWGIGYHNNHHARPREKSFAYSRYEFDPTVLLVWMIRRRSLSKFMRWCFN